MPTTSISFHKFYMYKKYNPSNIIPLNSFRSKGIINILEEYVKENCVNIQEDQGEKVLKYKKSGKNVSIGESESDETETDEFSKNKSQSDYTFLYWDNYRVKTQVKDGRDSFKYIHFIILGGKKGYFRIICNSKGKIAFLQKPEDSGLNFFNVFVAVPCNPYAIEGMIILEHKGIYSVQNSFFKKFIKFHNDDDITLKISNISDSDVVERLIRTAPIKELKLIKYYENPDSSESNFCEQEKRIFVKPAFTNLRTALKGLFQMGKCVGTQISRIDNFSPNDVSVTFDTGNGKNKTYGITNFQNVALVEYVDSNDGIEYDDKFEPTFDSIEKVLIQRFEDHRLVLKVHDDN